MPAGDSAGASRQGPIAGQRIATAAWARYSSAWDEYRAGRATLDEVKRARLAFDAAQEGVERAPQREAASWRRAIRR